MDTEIRQLAANQHGVVARRQLVELGLPATAIDHRLRAKTLRSVHRGVYALGHRELRRQGWWMAAVLASGAGAVLSHHTAAAAWGLVASRGRIHVTVPVAGGRTRRGGIAVHRVPGLHSADVTQVEGIPVTTVARTVIDMAAGVDEHRLEQIVHHADQRESFDRRAVEATMARCSARHGVPAVERLLARLDGVGAAATRSSFEVTFLRFCARHGLPRPVVNRHIAGWEVDFSWPGTNLVVETDGPHHRMPLQRERDHRKRLAVEAAGCRVVTLTEDQVKHDAEVTAASLLALLATR